MAATAVSFSHVHIYCDGLREVAEYKKLEEKLNAFANSARSAVAPTLTREGADIEAGRAAWLELSAAHGDPVTGKREPEAYSPARQDVVEQMLVGLGWRITGAFETPETRSVVVTSEDPDGVKMVVTAHTQAGIDELAKADPDAKQARLEISSGTEYFGSAAHLKRFAQLRNGRAGIAVLGFKVAPGGVDKVHAKYAELHPKLVLPGMPKVFEGSKVLEVFAYYAGDKGTSDADRGTLLRFVETTEDGAWVLPGVKKVEAVFDGTGQPAYCDHWVSNVVSREGFLDTLNETLGFVPKVDFNAGVVAAGEAQIESTVTGNNPETLLEDFQAALKDQSQVYLPTNNALSDAGHVHLYLKEIGQGVQHIASRVAELPALVQRANDFRKMTGAGLSFLSIPRSYYGSLSAKRLAKEAGLEASKAEQAFQALREAGIVDKSEAVDLEVTLEKVLAALPESVDRPKVAEHVLRGRYNNLYSLLRDHISEAYYLRIVRNNILVDVQGEDLLLQIFTSCVLQRVAGEEAPFFEFIQRVCSERKDPATGQPQPMKPGCGGFGIRNFLTLFLSIEVSKATKLRVDAEAAGNKEAVAYYGRMVDAFTAQLEESNPVLTAISDAMTAEGEALERGDKAEAERWAKEKAKGNEDLQCVSTKYRLMMKELRENAPAAAGA